jgi:choline dehydrogenase
MLAHLIYHCRGGVSTRLETGCRQPFCVGSLGMSVEVETVRNVEVPTRIVHGPGALARLGELVRELGVRRPFLVTDRGVVEAGLADAALEQLNGAVLFDEVRANPDIELIGRATAVYRSAGCDGLVALGGGSSIDTAKSVGVEAVHGGSIAEYEFGRTPLARRIPTLVAVPTTAGTGSEATLWAVVTDPERKVKFNVGGTPLIGPHVALVDPVLTLGLPPAITAATGMDALSHGIECYTCDYHQPFNDAVALAAVELVGRWLRVVYEDGADLEARTQMAQAATLGGLAYGTESAGAAHAMSQSAGGVHDCPHGALTARVLGPVCEFNAPAAPERYARIAQALGVDVDGLPPLEAAMAGVEETYRLTEAVGIPTMEQLGFSEDEIPMLARIAYEDPQTIGNPREVDVAAYEEIYSNAFARGKR